MAPKAPISPFLFTFAAANAFITVAFVLFGSFAVLNVGSKTSLGVGFIAAILCGYIFGASLKRVPTPGERLGFAAGAMVISLVTSLLMFMATLQLFGDAVPELRAAFDQIISVIVSLQPAIIVFSVIFVITLMVLVTFFGYRWGAGIAVLAAQLRSKKAAPTPSP